jgi:mono/diheme cytochrome c family protein
MKRKVVLAGLALLGLGTLGFADEYTASELRAIGEGRGLYLKNCVACHGAMARGAAENPDPAPGPNLTIIVVRDGAFDRNHVLSHINFGGQPVSGPRPEGAMPAWGRVLRAKNFGDQGQAACDILKLVQYLEYIQAQE